MNNLGKVKQIDLEAALTNCGRDMDLLDDEIKALKDRRQELENSYEALKAEIEARRAHRKESKLYPAFEFSTREYVMSHGKTPKGRGGWIFEARLSNGEKQNLGNFNGTLKEAKAQAVQAARLATDRGWNIYEIIICP